MKQNFIEQNFQKNITQNVLLTLVQQDFGLSPDERQMLTQALSQTDRYQKLMAGTSGALIANAAGKYMNLSKPAQILLSLAGFGIGSYLLKATRDSNNFVRYNDKMNAYELTYGRN